MAEARLADLSLTNNKNIDAAPTAEKSDKHWNKNKKQVLEKKNHLVAGSLCEMSLRAHDSEMRVVYFNNYMS
jgi:hypothetical protein